MGYIALAADGVTLTNSEKRNAELDEVRLGRYGCIQVAMLAGRADIQERADVKVGRSLIEHAQFVGVELGGRIGARFLTADVNPPAQGFYERCGFVSLAGEGDALQKARERGLIPMVRDLHPRTS